MKDCIAFDPWVGKNYDNGGCFHHKVLVLGESHHCEERTKIPPCLCENPFDKEKCRAFTKDILHDVVYYYTGEPYMRTFACFERAVLGNIPTQEQREELWESVAFYNYLQFAQSGPRRPIEQSTKTSENAFKQVLDLLLPDKVIIWGRHLYDILPNLDGHHIVISAANGSSTDGWVYPVNGKDISCMMVHHPSSPSGKNWCYWHPLYETFLND